MSDPTPPAVTYAQESAAADAMLDELLANIRRDAGTGEISAIEAADERIQVMEEHLATIRELRLKYFGSGE